MNSDFLCGRLSQSSQFGKCTEPVGTELPAPVLEALTVCHSLENIPRAQYLRNLIIDKLFGAVVDFPKATWSLEEAITGLAFVHGMSPEELKNKILTEYVFGLTYGLKNSDPQGESTLGNKISNIAQPVGFPMGARSE